MQCRVAKCLNFSFYQDIRANYLKVMNLDESEETFNNYEESDTEESEPEEEEEEDDVNKTETKIYPAKDSSDSDSESDS